MLSLFRRLVAAARGRRLAADLEDEIRAHYDALRQAFEDDGHAPPDAARLARLRLGGRLQIRESSRDEWRIRPFAGLAQDVRLAGRSLARRPGFAFAAITTLALGIGASTAVFSVAYGVSLRPLPYPEADRLVRLYESNPGEGRFEQLVSDGVFDAWRTGAPSLTSAALFNPPRLWWLSGADAPRLVTMSVSPAFFDVIGVRPMLGPGFTPESSYTRFTTTDVVLSFTTWQRLFNGRPDVIGQTLAFAGAGGRDSVFNIVGVMPEDFEFLEPVDVWFPAVVEPQFAMRLLSWRYGRVVGRLAPGATVERARAEAQAISARIAHEHAATSGGWTADVETLHASVAGQFARATWLLLATVVVVLVIACLNVGGLLTARAITRARETAVRVSLGAGQWRLLRLWFAEAVLLCVAGAAAGVALASLAVAALRAAAPPGIPRLDAIAIDAPAILGAIGAALLAATLFAVAPSARMSSRRHPAHELRTGSAPAGDRRERRAMQSVVVAAQCAGAAALVIVAVMLSRSFLRLTGVDLGWSAAGVVSASVEPGISRELRRPWYARVDWADRVVAALETSTGIRRAAIATQLPFGPAPYTATVARGRGKDAAAADERRWTVTPHKVSENFFDALGIALTNGRGFDRRDRFTEAQMTDSEVRPEAGAVIVSVGTARALWPGVSPIGQALWFADNTDNVVWREVVGVVEDIQFDAIGAAPALHVFLPWTQDSASARVFVIAATTDAAAAGPTVRQIVKTATPATAVDQIAALDALVSRAIAQPRFTSRVVAAFGSLALVLAAVGIYGTLAYLVSARTREIGVRLALGASRRTIALDVLRRGVAPAIVGGALGLIAALGIARTFRALLFEIAPADPLSSAVGAATLILVGLGASLGPALRASRVDPVRALRSD
jgi:predicted permease